MKNLAVRLVRESSASKLIVLAALLSVVFAGASWASLTGTTSVTTSSGSVFLGLVPDGTNPGTLLATETEPFSFGPAGSITSGSVISAVYQEADGMLDFYYQVENSSSSATSLELLTDFSFTGFTTAVGFLTDGDTLTPFATDGTVEPETANRSTAPDVSFNFTPPSSNALAPGQTSDVLVISTNATQYTAGFAAVQDSGNQTVASYQPAVPEPSYSILLGGGMLLLAGLRRKFNAGQ